MFGNKWLQRGPPRAFGKPVVLVGEQQAEVALQSPVDGIQQGKLDRVGIEFALWHDPRSGSEGFNDCKGLLTVTEAVPAGDGSPC